MKIFNKDFLKLKKYLKFQNFIYLNFNKKKSAECLLNNSEYNSMNVDEKSGLCNLSRCHLSSPLRTGNGMVTAEQSAENYILGIFIFTTPPNFVIRTRDPPKND
ncbi:hypothetical protein BpHYR1_047036 [Brachionus plicatilis]|uniref:Uncharacterized protein n=1 Tax=Brachionus plicatilis TaxID=10195 RepID=A0A3M7SQ26_BRAPC|nr:hypothetical protein BpHYR1_047036 [Brachionus plicatilis]